jgi:hypothetical protein
MSEKTVEITGVWLRMLGERVQVLVEADGTWRLVNDEPRHAPVSHITEPGGILKAPPDELTAKDG